MFKIKLKELINDIHKNHILGRTIARIYVVEFQNRGLPHAHILIFFTEDCKPHTVEDVDRMISAELLNSEMNKLAHETVARCTMHGPCGTQWANLINQWLMHPNFKIMQRRNYTTTEREALVMNYALHKFHHYLLGNKFIFYVYHMALLYLIKKISTFWSHNEMAIIVFGV